MNLSELPLSIVKKKITSEGLRIRIGRFNSLIRLPNINRLISDFYHLYQDSSVFLNQEYIDFTVSLELTQGIRAILMPQINFDFCGIRPFEPLPLAQSLPLLEWGMNWCVSQHFHKSLIIHAAVIEKHGKCIILPGLPGAGKSTLCAGLVNLGGWRLLSDELTLVDLDSGHILPNPRPISLKNQSIEIIKQLCPDLYCSTVVKDTVKGKVGLFKPTVESIEKVDEAVPAKYIIFPRYIEDSPFQMSKISRGRAFLELANQSFNYSVLGEKGFEAIAKQMDAVKCFELQYDGNMKQVINMMDELILS